MGAWYRASAISSLFKLKTSDLAPQRFWDAMARLGEAEICEIERRLAERITRLFRVDTSALVLDATNFFTFIDSATDSELAKRGHNKQKRHDLKQVGLALLVSVDHSVPLQSLCYPGNMADCRSFAALAGELVDRYKTFAASVGDITLVFDKGNNSLANLTALGASDYHFVGSLVPAHHKELLDVALGRFRPTEKFDGVATYRTTKEVFGVKRTLVVTFSTELAEKQRRGLDQTLAKACGQLAGLAAILERGRYKRSEAEIGKAIDEICEPRWVGRILKVELARERGDLRLHYRIDEAARSTVERTHFGKRILFTDRDDLSDEQIVVFYRTQNAVESAFRQMKDPTFISFSPMFHWTDDKIRVHVFYCVMALALTNLAWRRVHTHGIDISPKRMLAELSEIKLVDLLYPPASGKGRPRVQRTLSELSDLQRRLLSALRLEEYVPVGNTG